MAREKVFRFKQFSVRNDKSAMKVGTDGVLLGAWADVKAANSVLDIGTGTGLVALMMAQRCNANIDAIEIDADAFAEATLNFNESPWAERMKVIHDDFITFSKDCDLRYDVIVSNPPYFIDSLVCQEEKRKNARHTSSLSYENLIECAVKLLNDNGFIFLITPSDVENHLDNIIMMNNCYVANKTYIRPLLGGEVKRLLWKISKQECACVVEYMEIEKSRHEYTDEYIALTREYYLKM